MLETFEDSPEPVFEKMRKLEDKSDIVVSLSRESVSRVVVIDGHKPEPQWRIAVVTGVSEIGQSFAVGSHELPEEIVGAERVWDLEAVYEKAASLDLAE